MKNEKALMIEFNCLLNSFIIISVNILSQSPFIIFEALSVQSADRTELLLPVESDAWHSEHLKH